MSKKRDYDWLDDPFNEKKSAQETGMSKTTRTLLGCGCVVVVLGIFVLIAAAGMGFMSLASSL